MNKSKVQRSGREAIEFHYDDDIRTKKLYMLHKISLGHCPDYFASYIKYLKDTRASKRNTVLLPSYKRTAGCKTFQVSSIRLWNNIDLNVRNILSHRSFLNTIERTSKSQGRIKIYVNYSVMF